MRIAGPDFAASRYDGFPIERQLARMHRTGAAEREQRKVARIESALDGDDADGAFHVGVDDANHAVSGGIGRRFHGGREASNRTCGTFGKNLHLAAKKAFRDEPSRDEVSVGDGGEVAASITRWPRICPGTFRADAQRAARIDTRDRSATGTDGVDIDHGRAHRVSILVAERADARTAIEQ